MGGETPQAMIADNGSTLLASINTLNMTQDWQDLVSVNLLELSFYVFLFTIGGSANAYVVYNLAWGKRLTSTRHEKLLLNLAIADAIVTLVMTPTEIAWRITASWKAGNLMCKLFQFYRLFGIYLSSMVLICISIDRLLAVYSPFKYQTYDIFVKKLLIVAWLLSFIFALPQIFIFHVESPSEFPGFTQCVSFKSFQTETQLRMYNIFCLSIIYFVPLLCISLCYTFICVKIRRKMVRRFLTVFRNGDLTTVVNPEVQHSETIGFTSNQLQSAQNCHSPHPHSNANGCDLTTEGATLTRPSSSSAPVAPVTTPSRGSLRCIVLPVSSASRQRQKIGSKIVKDTVIIIAAFIVCWTPYATIHLWYQIDWSSAFQVDKSLQGVLFLFAISNSCVNPYIYGKIFDPTCLLKQ